MDFEKCNIYVDDLMSREKQVHPDVEEWRLSVFPKKSIKEYMTPFYDTIKISITKSLLPVQRLRFSIRVSDVNTNSIKKTIEKLPPHSLLAVFVVGESKSSYLRSLRLARKITDPRVVFFFSLRAGYPSSTLLESIIRATIASRCCIDAHGCIPEFIQKKYPTYIESYLSNPFTVLHNNKNFSTQDISHALHIITDRVHPMNFDYLLSGKYINTPLIPKDTFKIFSSSQSELKSSYSTYSIKIRTILDELDILSSDISWYVHKPHSNLSTLRKYIRSYIKKHSPYIPLHNLIDDLYNSPSFSLLPSASTCVLLALSLSEYMYSPSYTQSYLLVESPLSPSHIQDSIQYQFNKFLDPNTTTRPRQYTFHILYRKQNPHKLIHLLSSLFPINNPPTLIQLSIQVSSYLSSIKMHPAFYGEYTSSSKLKLFFKHLSYFLNTSIDNPTQLEEHADTLLTILSGDSNLKKQIKQTLHSTDRIKKLHPQITIQLPEAFYWLYEYGIAKKIFYKVPTNFLITTLQEAVDFHTKLSEAHLNKAYLDWLKDEDNLTPFVIPE